MWRTMSRSRGRMPKLASQNPMVWTRLAAAKSISPSTRSRLMRVIFDSVAAPQSQNVHP